MVFSRRSLSDAFAAAPLLSAFAASRSSAFRAISRPAALSKSFQTACTALTFCSSLPPIGAASMPTLALPLSSRFTYPRKRSRIIS